MSLNRWLRRFFAVSWVQHERALKRIEELCFEGTALSVRIAQLENLYDECEAQRERELRDIGDALGRKPSPDGYAPPTFVLVTIARMYRERATTGKWPGDEPTRRVLRIVKDEEKKP